MTERHVLMVVAWCYAVLGLLVFLGCLVTGYDATWSGFLATGAVIVGLCPALIAYGGMRALGQGAERDGLEFRAVPGREARRSADVPTGARAAHLRLVQTRDDGLDDYAPPPFSRPAAKGFHRDRVSPWGVN